MHWNDIISKNASIKTSNQSCCNKKSNQSLFENTPPVIWTDIGPNPTFYNSPENYNKQKIKLSLLFMNFVNQLLTISWTDIGLLVPLSTSELKTFRSWIYRWYHRQWWIKIASKLRLDSIICNSLNNSNSEQTKAISPWFNIACAKQECQKVSIFTTPVNQSISIGYSKQLKSVRRKIWNN